MKIQFVAMALLAGLAGCGPVDDQLVYNFGSAPAPRAEFEYSNDESADIQLYSSLRNLGDVRATFDPTQQVPSRLGRWQQRLKANGNKMIVCDTVIAAGGSPISIPFVPDFVGDLIYDAARSRVMYNPTKNFNAIVEYDSSANALTGMRFVSTDETLATVESEYGECRQ